MQYSILRWTPIFLFLLVCGCRTDEPREIDSTTARDTTRSSPTSALPTDSTSGTDSGITSIDAVTGAPTSPVAPSVRTALIDSVRTFMSAVESGRSERFWQMLSDRSLRAIGTESGGTREQIWDAARETLT